MNFFQYHCFDNRAEEFCNRAVSEMEEMRDSEARELIGEIKIVLDEHTTAREIKKRIFALIENSDYE